MKLNKYYIFLSILILLILVFFFTKKSEYFQDYQLLPYGEVYTGNDPLYFYNYNRFRKPYMWPFKYFSSYPYPHMNPLP